MTWYGIIVKAINVGLLSCRVMVGILGALRVGLWTDLGGDMGFCSTFAGVSFWGAGCDAV